MACSTSGRSDTLPHSLADVAFSSTCCIVQGMFKSSSQLSLAACFSGHLRQFRCFFGGRQSFVSGFGEAAKLLVRFAADLAIYRGPACDTAAMASRRAIGCGFDMRHHRAVSQGHSVPMCAGCHSTCLHGHGYGGRCFLLSVCLCKACSLNMPRVHG